MFCRQCGTEVDEASAFCSKCGFNLKEGVAQKSNKTERPVINQKVYQPPSYSHSASQYSSGMTQEKRVFGVGKIVSGIIMMIIGALMSTSTSSSKDSLRYYFDSDYQSGMDIMSILAIILVIAGLILLIVGLVGKKEYVYSNNGSSGYGILSSNGPTSGWRCGACGKVNADYVGVCGCGNKR